MAGRPHVRVSHFGSGYIVRFWFKQDKEKTGRCSMKGTCCPMAWQGEYPFGRAYTGIRGGNHIWREWIHCIGATHDATEVVAMFDKHHVVDTLSWQNAMRTGIDMDHMDDVSSVICSYGRSHQQKTWLR